MLSGYTLIIQLQFLFSYYDLDHASDHHNNLIKVVLLNGFSFYVQVRFIHPRFIPIYLVLFIPFYLFEISRLIDLLKKWVIWLSSIDLQFWNYCLMGIYRVAKRFY